VMSEQASSSMSLIVHSADKQVKGKFDLFSFFPGGRKETGERTVSTILDKYLCQAFKSIN